MTVPGPLRRKRRGGLHSEWFLSFFVIVNTLEKQSTCQNRVAVCESLLARRTRKDSDLIKSSTSFLFHICAYVL